MKMPLYRRRPGSRSGFALIVVITLMILLTLLSIGLLTLSTVSLRTSNTALARTEAQANARMALAIALGELQKQMGPDQRITARRDVLSKDPRIGGEVSSGSPEAWWVGVAHGDSEQTLENDQPVAWLVSGLNPSGAPSSGLAGDPVEMFGEQSLDLAKYTGGDPIQAGKVPIQDGRGKITGGYAWIVDDEGMKAQLAPTNPLATNEENAGRGVLPSGYNLTILSGLENLADQSPESFAKIASLGELEFLGAGPEIAASKRFDYTPRSYGVLADVRKGGLKKDLTIAFENESVFDSAFSPGPFPMRRGADRYLLLDSARLSEASELSSSGYIHWDVFREYYNLKRWITTKDRRPVLYPTLLNKIGFIGNPRSEAYFTGGFGPHNANTSGAPSYFPYGDLRTLPSNNRDKYLHNPITPILQSLQMNGWIEQTREELEIHTQMFTSHYNPYNISISLEGRGSGAQKIGARIINFPRARYTLTGTFTNQDGMAAKRQSHGEAVILEPGRSQVYGFSRDVVKGGDSDDQNYTPNIGQVVNQAVIHKVSGTAGGRSSLTVEFVLDRAAMTSGNDDKVGGGAFDYEVSQYFYAPFALHDCGGFPGIKRELPGVLSASNKASMVFALRTSTETDGQSVRPLIDANIRAIWNNPRWDSPLGLPALAGYSIENEMAAFDQPPQMAPGGRGDVQGSAFTYWGNDRGATGYERVILFDIPRQDLVSLGQLQHAAAGRFSYEPTYIVGNSYANPRIPNDSWKAEISDTFSRSNPIPTGWSISGNFNLYDASYLVNEVLWDSYIFTTIPQDSDNFRGGDVPPDYAALLSGDLLLPNPRFIPYEPAGSAFDAATLRQEGRDGAFMVNAGHLLVDGAFNINSTSVDAWEAFLSGTSRLPVQEIGANGVITGFSPAADEVRFPRVNGVFGEGTDATGDDENFWTGFRKLSQEEVRKIAEEIVVEIRKRGPAHGLGAFVNRRLESDEPGDSGPLQAALDRAVNHDLPSGIGLPTKNSELPDGSSQAAGFPGYLMQGDVLQALSPYMSARSDTFTIRAYGESVNAASGKVEARAWCEAKVQRYPDPVPFESGGSALAELANPTSEFGRQFRVLAFRWLNPDEI